MSFKSSFVRSAFGSFVLLLLQTNFVFAEAVTTGLTTGGPAPEPEVFDHFFTVDDHNLAVLEQKLASLMGMNFGATGISYSEIRPQGGKTDAQLNLLEWVRHEESFGSTPEKYNRKLHFGQWLKKKLSDRCFYTRSEVLARDSKSAVQRKIDDDCVVTQGDWDDPYSGSHFTDPKDIQIDHFVPLKNAYVSGAYSWDYRKRCLYANFLENSIHLLSVSGDENIAKLDHGPEKYMPPNRQFRCEYLKRWLTVKTIWNLGLNPLEVKSINDFVDSESCDFNSFQVPTKSLKDQRTAVLKNLGFCASMSDSDKEK